MSDSLCVSHCPGQNHPTNILTLGLFYQGMYVLGWYMTPNDIKQM